MRWRPGRCAPSRRPSPARAQSDRACPRDGSGYRPAAPAVAEEDEVEAAAFRHTRELHVVFEIPGRERVRLRKPPGGLVVTHGHQERVEMKLSAGCRHGRSALRGDSSRSWEISAAGAQRERGVGGHTQGPPRRSAWARRRAGSSPDRARWQRRRARERSSRRAGARGFRAAARAEEPMRRGSGTRGSEHGKAVHPAQHRETPGPDQRHRQRGHAPHDDRG